MGKNSVVLDLNLSYIHVNLRLKKSVLKLYPLNAPRQNGTSVAIVTQDFGFYILLPTKNQGSLEKWLICGGTGQVQFVSLEHFDMTESNEPFKT